MELRTQPRLASGGDAVARAADGRVVFVSGAAPDESVEVAIDEDNRTFLRGHVVRILEPGPARVPPPCPLFGRCGGCTLQHLAPAEQTRSKHAAVLETVARLGKVELAEVVVAEPWSGAAEAYRTRARFAVGGDRRIGFRAAKSRAIVDVPSCLVLHPMLARALERLREAVAALPREARLPREEELDVVATDTEALVGLPSKLAAPARHGGRAPAGGAGLGALASVFREDAAVRLVSGAGDALVQDDPKRGRMLLAPDVFAQANGAGNAALVDEVEALVGEGARGAGSTIVELYAGSGNFTRRLALLADRVRASELEGAASRLARRALPASVELERASAEEALRRMVAAKETADVLVVDPPRTGLSPEVVELALRLEPRVMVYVSCDPATFARDVGRLALGGLHLDRLRTFDLYPHTAHVEVVGRLTRRSP